MAFHDFSRSLCRLSRSSRLQPFFPIRPVPFSKAESVIIYDTIKTQPASTDTKPIVNDGRPKVPDNILYWQKFFQENTDKPVFLMRGTIDKVLFGTSCTGVVIGLAMCGYYLWPLLWIK